ncbi:NADH-quinone oxidoreductase subunit NuoK [Adhaeribacter radiodurans]|uniref:NADH-quinone oxidoreductase subunit NuoK n=1 Tax=Adhaeribacter radiodurans TaxID=2745197 RepID=UPI00293C05E7|nr:NADH-quinone oxidoreductase subunit NuoK [Adhaeribacter radiodurans]
MASIPLEHLLLLSAALFCIGILAIVTKRHAVAVLMGIELIFNAANLNLLAFSQHDPTLLQGQVFALFVIIIAAAEAAIALAIILKVYQYFNTVNVNEVDTSRG